MQDDKLSQTDVVQIAIGVWFVITFVVGFLLETKMPFICKLVVVLVEIWWTTGLVYEILKLRKQRIEKQNESK